MQRVDTTSSIGVIPGNEPLGSPGYFTKGDPTLAVAATVPGQDWFNSVQEEICYPIIQAGLTLDKTDRTQLYQAIMLLTWNPGNDGAGSGLDADLWDGNQFNSYLNQPVRTDSSPTFAAVNNISSTALAAIAALSVEEIEQIDPSKKVVAGFTYSNIFYIDDDGDGQNNNFFSVTGIVTEATWQTLGPIGSGSVHIWSAMDAAPIGTKYFVLAFDSFGGTESSLIVNGRRPGSTAPANQETRLVNAGISDRNSVDRYIPCNTSRQIEIYSTWGLSAYSSILVKGFGVG